MINKSDIISKYQQKDGDTGSTEVQIALLTARINHITEHLKSNKQDNSAKRGLLMLIGKRNGLLKYLESKDIDKYRELKKSLGIR